VCTGTAECSLFLVLSSIVTLCIAVGICHSLQPNRSGSWHSMHIVYQIAYSITHQTKNEEYTYTC
jgi:hypothetical protein